LGCVGVQAGTELIVVFLVTSAAEPPDFQRFCVIVVVSVSVNAFANFAGATLDQALDHGALGEAAGPLAFKAKLGALLLAVVPLALAETVTVAVHAPLAGRRLAADFAVACHFPPDLMENNLLHTA
jgi:hypothetical protein